MYRSQHFYTFCTFKKFQFSYFYKFSLCKQAYIIIPIIAVEEPPKQFLKFQIFVFQFTAHPMPQLCHVCLRTEFPRLYIDASLRHECAIYIDLKITGKPLEDSSRSMIHILNMSVLSISQQNSMALKSMKQFKFYLSDKKQKILKNCQELIVYW